MQSVSRTAVIDDNPNHEALFRTLKYSLAYQIKLFADIEKDRQGVYKFVTSYNCEHRNSDILFVTLVQRHNGKDRFNILNRKIVYEAIKLPSPYRWKNLQTRSWDGIELVWLNPPKEHCNIRAVLKREA
jgi:putative transposase